MRTIEVDKKPTNAQVGDQFTVFGYGLDKAAPHAIRVVKEIRPRTIVLDDNSEWTADGRRVGSESVYIKATTPEHRDSIIRRGVMVDIAKRFTSLKLLDTQALMAISRVIVDPETLTLVVQAKQG